EQLVGRSCEIHRRPLLDLLLEFLDLLFERFDLRRQLGGPAAEAVGQTGDHRIFRLDRLDRFLRRHAGEPPHALADRFFADDLEEADLAGVLQVRAAAEFAGKERITSPTRKRGFRAPLAYASGW